MATNIVIVPFRDLFSLASIRVYVNGKKIGRLPVGFEHEIETKLGDRISFRIQYFRADFVVSDENNNLIVYWDVPANAIKGQLKMMFTNCLKVISVDAASFSNPSIVYKHQSASNKIKVDGFLSISGALLALSLIYFSVVYNDLPEWWTNLAMAIGIAGIFRFLSFVFSKTVSKYSFLSAFVLFSLVLAFLALTGFSLFGLKIAYLFVSVMLMIKSYQVYSDKQRAIN